MENLLSTLALSACPLMMLFCMKGMFGGKKDCHNENSQSDVSKKLENLEQQNAQLMKELNELKKHQIS